MFLYLLSEKAIHCTRNANAINYPMFTGFVMIKSEVARARLENNTAVIPAEFIVTASLRKCLKRTL